MLYRKALPLPAILAVMSIGFMAAKPAVAQQREREEDERSEKAAWPPTAPSAKISPVQAMATARKKLGGGTAFQATFEHEDGRWVYGVLIVKGHKLTEVVVDSQNGKVLDTEAVTPADEAKEVTEELKKVAAAGG